MFFRVDAVLFTFGIELVFLWKLHHCNNLVDVLLCLKKMLPDNVFIFELRLQYLVLFLQSFDQAFCLTPLGNRDDAVLNDVTERRAVSIEERGLFLLFAPGQLNDPTLFASIRSFCTSKHVMHALFSLTFVSM